MLHKKDTFDEIQVFNDPTAQSESKNIQKIFATGRGKIVYASTSTGPDTSYETAQLSQMTAKDIDAKSMKFLDKTIRMLHDPPSFYLYH